MPESGRAMGGVPDVARRATAVLSASALAASCHGPTAAFCCCRSHPSERSRLGPRWDAIRWGSPFAQRLQPQLCLTLAYGSAARWVGRRAGAAAREGRAPLGGPASGPSLLPSENTQLQLVDVEFMQTFGCSRLQLPIQQLPIQLPGNFGGICWHSLLAHPRVRQRVSQACLPP